MDDVVLQFTIKKSILEMKKILFMAVVAGLVVSSCSKEFTKKHEARFKVNGTQYNVGEDGVSAGYESSNKLRITASGGSSQTFSPTIVVDLTKVNEQVNIDSAQSGWNYYHSNSASYIPKRGTWEITSYKEGNPASRHTEGNFSMVVFDPLNPSDTFNITDGYFYVNNYWCANEAGGANFPSRSFKTTSK